MNEQGIIEYINNLIGLRHKLPYEQIGKLLAEILVPAFSSDEFEEYVKRHAKGTYVRPNETVTTYSPFWNTKGFLNYISRKEAQQKTIKALRKDPTVFISCDGGLYHNTSDMNPTQIIRQSAIIQAPLLVKPVIHSKSFYVQPELLINKDPSAYMTAGEFRTLICLMQQLNGDKPSCNSYGCPNLTSEKCPLNKDNLSKYINLIKNHSIKIVCFMDRPVIPSYLLRYSRGEFSLIKKIYNELLQCARKYDVPIISVIQSSHHKAITTLILDLLAGRAYIPESLVVKPFRDFLTEYPEFIKNIHLENEVAKRYNLRDTEDLILLLNDQWRESEFSNIFMDYSIFKHIINGAEFRSNSFTLYDYATANSFPGTEFNFFYVGYINDWVRVEYTNTNSSKAAQYYYMQTCLGENYPFIVKIAHERAIIRRNFIKSLNLILRKYGFNRPTIKSKSKLKVL